MQKAKKKKVAKTSPSELGVDVKSSIEVLQVVDPPERQAGVKVENVQELVAKLKDAGVV